MSNFKQVPQAPPPIFCPSSPSDTLFTGSSLYDRCGSPVIPIIEINPVIPNVDKLPIEKKDNKTIIIILAFFGFYLLTK